MKTRLAEAVIAGFILFLSGEILVRRWLFDQIPTPIGAAPTYALLSINFLVLAAMLRQTLRRSHSPKTLKV